MIEEAGTGRLIDSAVPWKNRFAPGQSVLMSVVFKETNSQRTSCPRCKSQQDSSSDEEITWSAPRCILSKFKARLIRSSAKCRTVYRRIEGVDDDRSDQASLVTDARSNTSDVDPQSKAILGPKIQPNAERGETIETSAYRRIQIIELRDNQTYGKPMSSLTTNDFTGSSNDVGRHGSDYYDKIDNDDEYQRLLDQYGHSMFPDFEQPPTKEELFGFAGLL